MNFKLSWSKDELKRHGHNVYDVKRYLEANHCHVGLFSSGKISFQTPKSANEIYVELKTNFNMEFTLDI